MYKYILEKAGEINWMGLFSLVTFFTIFTLVIIMILRSDKKHIKHMSDLPLSDDSVLLKNENK